jgi:hypothetical protein
MKSLNIKYTGSILLIMLMIVCSCKKILSPEIRGQIALANLVKTQSGIITVINGAYAPLESMYNGPMERLTDLASDDGWTWRNELEPDLYIVTPTFLHSHTVWTNSYKGITTANIVLAHADEVPDFSSNMLRNCVKGQARFLRAFYYFNLVRLFGGVPLVVNEIISRSDAELPRVSIQEVYTQIETDLDSAIALLPASYDNSFGLEAGRPTTYSASALKSLVHLELDEWDAAISAADAVIGHGNFALLSNYAANFNGTMENGPGSLFEAQYSATNPSTVSSISNFYAPTNYKGSALILPTDDSLHGGGGGPSSGNSFVQAIENGDLRKEVIISTYGLPNFINATKPSGTLFFVNKYYNTADPVGQSSWNFPLIRYAEILLTKAEALNEKGYIADGEAFTLLNQVRSKAGLTPLTAADLTGQEAFRQAVRHERRIELAFECKRYFDLNRWGILGSTIQPQLDFLGLKFPTERTITHPVTGKNYFLYPLPSTEFINNAQLGDQNPGYN